MASRPSSSHSGSWVPVPARRRLEASPGPVLRSRSSSPSASGPMPANIGSSIHRRRNASTVTARRSAVGRVELGRPGPRRTRRRGRRSSASSMPAVPEMSTRRVDQVGAGQGQMEAEPRPHRVAEVGGPARRRGPAGGPRRPGSAATPRRAAVAGHVDRHHLVVGGQVVVHRAPHPTGLGEAVGHHQRAGPSPRVSACSAGGGGRAAAAAGSGWARRRHGALR